MGEHPGLRLVGPKVSFEQIIKWAEDAGLDVKQLESTYEQYGWPEGYNPKSPQKRAFSLLGLFLPRKLKKEISPKQVLKHSWKVIADNEIGLYFETSLDVLDRWSDAKLADLEAFIRKLQENCRELYYFYEFNGGQWWALDKYGKIPWRPVPKKGIIKFLMEW